MGEYRLNDDIIFHPSNKKLTPEEEKQLKQDAEIFCDMIEKTVWLHY